MHSFLYAFISKQPVYNVWPLYFISATLKLVSFYKSKLMKRITSQFHTKLNDQRISSSYKCFEINYNKYKYEQYLGYDNTFS